jgi:hypothetical protein
MAKLDNRQPFQTLDEVPAEMALVNTLLELSKQRI